MCSLRITSIHSTATNRYVVFLFRRCIPIQQLCHARYYATADKNRPPFDNAKSASVRLDPAIDDKKFPGFGRVGQIKMPVVRLPPELDLAVRNAFRNSVHKNRSKIEECGRDLKNMLWSRKMKITEEELQEQAAHLETRAINHLVSKNPAIMAPDNAEQLERKTVKLVTKRLKSMIAKWTPLQFTDEFDALAYTHGLLASNYASLYRAIKEIRVRDQNFRPNLVADFGCGLGTAYWVIKDLWKDHPPQQYHGYDTSPVITQLAMRLLETLDRGTEHEQSQPVIDHTKRGIYFRQQLPGPDSAQVGEMDLVVCDRTLCELEHRDDRRMVLGSLWEKTKTYLVLIENGTKVGHRLLMEARNSLVSSSASIERIGFRRLLEAHNVNRALAEKISSSARRMDEQSLNFVRSQLEPSVFQSILPEIPTIWPTGEIFAPCPHSFLCPKLALDQPCNFPVRYHPLDLTDNMELANADPMTEPVSYLIFAKTPNLHSQLINSYLSSGSNDTRDEHVITAGQSGDAHGLSIDQSVWPRVMKDCSQRDKSATIHLCTASGQLQDVIVSKRVHGAFALKIAKKMAWGDRLPFETDLEIPDQEQPATENENNDDNRETNEGTERGDDEVESEACRKYESS